MSFSCPAPITPEHDLSTFTCGHPGLDNWLRLRAAVNQRSGASRTYVVADGGRVVAFYALATGGLVTGQATGRFRRNMPDPIPVAVLARLAVDKSVQGEGIGRALFQDAARRVLAAADMIGMRGLIVHAISDDAANFYEKLGLSATPAEAKTFMITLDELRAAL